MRVQEYNNKKHVFYFFCPGCREYHSVYTNGKAAPDGSMNTFNGNKENPTFDSMITRVIEKFNKTVHTHPEYQCNSFIKDGKIRFLENCSHDLKNRIVDLSKIS